MEKSEEDYKKGLKSHKDKKKKINRMHSKIKSRREASRTREAGFSFMSFF